MISFENCKDIAIGSFFRNVRTKPRKKVLIESKSLVKIFEVGFLGVPSCKVHIFNVYKNLAKSSNT